MILENTEYGISKLMTNGGSIDSITISKKALEEWRDHYLSVAERYDDDDIWKWFYAGKANALTEILKHFDEEL